MSLSLSLFCRNTNVVYNFFFLLRKYSFFSTRYKTQDHILTTLYLNYVAIHMIIAVYHVFFYASVSLFVFVCVTLFCDEENSTKIRCRQFFLCEMVFYEVYYFSEYSTTTPPPKKKKYISHGASFQCAAERDRTKILSYIFPFLLNSNMN